jgi:hypothetical protein
MKNGVARSLAPNKCVNRIQHCVLLRLHRRYTLSSTVYTYSFCVTLLQTNYLLSEGVA